MPAFPRTPVVRVGAAGLVLLLGLTACSGSDEPEPTPTPAPSVDAERVAPEKLPEAPELEDAEGAVTDISYDPCAVEAGEQEVAGEVRNSSDDEADYVITVSWINGTSDVRGRGIAVVEDVEPGETKKWSLAADVLDGAVQCAPNVLRGTLTD